MNQPPGGDPQDYWPTQELGPVAGPARQAGPAGPAGPAGHPGHPGQATQAGPTWGQPSGQAWHQAPGPGGPSTGTGPRGAVLRRGRLPGGALRWSAGLALVGLLAGAGAFAATRTASPSPAGPTGQAAVLNSMLNSSSSPGADGAPANAAAASSTAPGTPCRTRTAKLKSAGHPFAARVALWRCHHALQRVRALGGIHGQFTFETKTGTRTIAYERGVVQSVSGSDVVVRAKDGTTWTWVLGSSTAIRESGKRVAASSLTDGQNVFAGGPVVSGAYDARLVVIRASSGTPSPSPSSSPASG